MQALTTVPAAERAARERTAAESIAAECPTTKTTIAQAPATEGAVANGGGGGVCTERRPEGRSEPRWGGGSEGGARLRGGCRSAVGPSFEAWRCPLHPFPPSLRCLTR